MMEMTAVLGNSPIPKGGLFALGITVWPFPEPRLCWASMSELSSTCLYLVLYCATNLIQVISTPSMLHQWLKESQTIGYFKSTGKEKEIPIYSDGMSPCIYMVAAKDAFCLQS